MAHPRTSPAGCALARAGAWLRRLALAWIACAAGAAFAAPVIVLDVQDAIGPASASYVLRGMAAAAERGAPLVVIRLDTPGGLDTAMRQIIQAILASPVPVAIYVSPEGARAASAGTYILYASHIAAMAPATTLGAATPVAIGMPGGGDRPQRERAPASRDDGKADGEGSKKKDDGEAARRPAAPSDPMTAKQVHDAAAFIRGLAQQRGRNAEWAERAVREAVTLTATEAVRQNVADILAADVPDLLAQAHGRRVRVPAGEVTLQTRGAEIERMAPDWRHRLLSVIANPSFALILLMVGFYGLLFEFSSPGFGLPGTVGAICLLLGLFALQLLPINYAGLALIALGIALLVAEVLSPTFGVLGVGGAVALLAGLLLLFDRDVPHLAVPLWLIFGITATSVLVVLVGGTMALRARRRPVVTGTAQMVGAHGIVRATGPDGAWAQIQGEHWRVTSDEVLQPGQAVRVVAMHGLILHVRADAGPAFPPPPSDGAPR